MNSEISTPDFDIFADKTKLIVAIMFFSKFILTRNLLFVLPLIITMY
jgi:hypothetical protein